ncbi:hypothetical protein [Nonomuraea wenchangensis]
MRSNVTPVRDATSLPGSPCRSRSGAVTGTYHSGRFARVPLARQTAAGSNSRRPQARPNRRRIRRSFGNLSENEL